jgi:hypothetical protein
MSRITLELIEGSFREWRAKRNSPVEPIPENLWAMALRLHPQHKRSEICKRLRLSGSQLKQRLEGSAYPSAEHGFVLASNDEVKADALSMPDVQLTIQGKERVLTLHVGMHVLGQIIPHLSVLL